MALSNYSNISDAVAEWLNREGFTSITDRAEDFIIMAQRRIAREIRIPPMESVSTLTVNSSGEGTVPTDFMQVKYLLAESASTAWYLEHGTFVEVKKRQVDSAFREPLVFDIEGSTIYIGAIPTNSETFTLVYYKELEFISTSVSTNWFSSYAPEMILFGAMCEAAFFMKDWELWQTCEQKYKDAKALLLYQRDKAEHSGSPLSVKIARTR